MVILAGYGGYVAHAFAGTILHMLTHVFGSFYQSISMYITSEVQPSVDPREEYKGPTCSTCFISSTLRRMCRVVIKGITGSELYLSTLKRPLSPARSSVRSQERTSPELAVSLYQSACLVNVLGFRVWACASSSHCTQSKLDSSTMSSEPCSGPACLCASIEWPGGGGGVS